MAARNEFLLDIVQQMEADGHPAVPLMAAAARQNRIVQQFTEAASKQLKPTDLFGTRTDKVVDGVRCSSTYIYHHSTAAQEVWVAMHMVDVTTPFAEELPHELLRAFSADPTSAYAAAWREFVTMVWAPGVTKLAAILDAHQSVMELPPMEWCEATFPAMNWSGTSVEWIMNSVQAYAALFEVVVAKWERGEFDVVRPSMLCPLTAAHRFVTWSGTAAQQRLQQLIGMTEQAEKHADASALYAAAESVTGPDET